MLKILVIGNLGNDPEMRYTPAGHPVTSFSVASNRQYTNAAGEKVKETTWCRCTAWGKLAETVNQYLRKGRQVFIEGRLNGDASGNPRIWQRADGSSAASFEVTVENIQFLGTGNGSDAAPSGEATPEATEEENIPF